LSGTGIISRNNDISSFDASSIPIFVDVHNEHLCADQHAVIGKQGFTVNTAGVAAGQEEGSTARVIRYIDLTFTFTIIEICLGW
jgi:hypothetical protein